MQTILRRFGSKAGLLEAAHLQVGETVRIRRAVSAGDIEHSVNALTNDYEAVGDLVTRLLVQEERHTDLIPILDRGRAGHRDWLAEVFASYLAPLAAAKRIAALDALVVATDICIWKLVRREMKRSIPAYKTIVRNMLQAILRDGSPDTTPIQQSNKRLK